MLKNDFETLIKLLDKSEELRPIIKQVLSILKSYGPEVETFLNMITDGIVTQKTNMFHEFIDNDFSRNEALILTISTYNDLLSIKLKGK
jgi:hypothetical protein